MKHLVAGITAAGLALVAGTSQAAQQTVTLDVPNAMCPACPMIIERALGATPGVRDFDLNYAWGRVTVTYDDDRTDAATLRRSIAKAREHGVRYTQGVR